MIYFGTRLSDNLSRREPEGYLICLNVPVARTGTQEYLPEELGLPPGSPVPVYRPEEEVFAPACQASFEGMPVTDDHPSFPEGVTAENIRWLQKGHAHNVRRGTGKEADLLLADLIITDPGLIGEILGGKREISCGYNYTLCEEGGRYVQRDIRGNHIAVVDAGRAGPRVSIKDEKTISKDERSKNTMKKTQMNGMKRMMQGRTYAKRTARLMARMARDGETEELAEMIAELVEPEGIEAAPDEPAEEIAETVEEILEEGNAAETEPVAIAVPEDHPITIDEEARTYEEEIVALLRQILNLMQPAADCGGSCGSSRSGDEDPGEPDIAEAMAEAVTEAMIGADPGAPGIDPLETMVAEAVEEAVSENPSETAELVGEVLESVFADPEAGDDNPVSGVMEPDPDRSLSSGNTGDALRAAMATFRPILKAMNPDARRRAVTGIAAGLKARDRNRAAFRTGGEAARDTYALLAKPARRASGNSGAELGRRIMEKRNANLKK